LTLPENRSYLLGKFPNGKIYNRFRNILNQVQDILEGMDIIDSVQVNTDVLELAVLDYFEDIDRLKSYQGIPRVNVEKIYSYGAFWFLRRGPIQIIDPNLAQEHLHINEKVCVAIILPKMLAEMGFLATHEDGKIFSLLDLIYYNFKYRTFTQHSLELMIEAFFCGCVCFAPREDVNGHSA